MHRIFALARHFILVPVLATLVGALTLSLFETVVLLHELANRVRELTLTLKDAKLMAVGLIEAIDVFLISIAAYVMSMSLYALFIDERLALPPWLQVNDLEDLKANLISIVIAVLGVLFLRQAFAWEGGTDILYLGAAVALVIGTLTFFVTKKGAQKD